MYFLRNPVVVHPLLEGLGDKIGDWISKIIEGWLSDLLSNILGMMKTIIPGMKPGESNAAYYYRYPGNYSALSFRVVANKDIPADKAVIPGMNYLYLIFQTIGWAILIALVLSELYKVFFSSMTGNAKQSPFNVFGRLIIAVIMMILTPQIIYYMCYIGDQLMYWISSSMMSGLGMTSIDNLELSWTSSSMGGFLLSCIFCGALAYNLFMAYLNQIERFVVFGISVQLFPIASAMYATKENEDSARNYFVMLFSQIFAIMMNNALFVLLVYKLNNMDGTTDIVNWVVAIALCGIAKSSERLLNALGIHAMPTPEAARNFTSGMIGAATAASAGLGAIRAGIHAGAGVAGAVHRAAFGSGSTTARTASVAGSVAKSTLSADHIKSPKDTAVDSMVKRAAQATIDGNEKLAKRSLTRGDMNRALMDSGFIKPNANAISRTLTRGMQSLPGGAIYQAKKEIGTRAAMASAITKGTTGVIAGTNSATAAKIMGLSGKTASGAAFGFNSSAIKRNADGSFTLSGTAVKNGNAVSSSMRVMPSSKQMADITGLSSAMPKVSWSSSDTVKTNAAGNYVLTGTTMRNLKNGGQSAYVGKYELGSKADILAKNPLRNYVPVSENGNYVASMIKGNPALINDIAKINNAKTNNNILAKGTQTSGDIVNRAFETSYTMDGFRADHACKVNYGDNYEKSAILMAGTMPTNDQSEINQMYAIVHGDNPDFDELQKQTQYSVNPGSFYDLGDGYRAYHAEPVELDPSKNEAEIKLQKATRAMLYSEDASSAAKGGYYNQADDSVNGVLEQKEREMNERENESNKHDEE